MDETIGRRRKPTIQEPSRRVVPYFGRVSNVDGGGDRSDCMDKDLETARENRDVIDALLRSGLPNDVEDRVLSALDRAGLRSSVEFLMGNCQRNAVAVRDEFRQSDFDAIAIRGWVSDPESHIVPRDFGEAVERDVVHWWTEVEIMGDWYTVDLAANTRENWGDLYVSTTRPSVYRPEEIEPDDMDAVRTAHNLEPPRGLFDEPL